MASTRGGRRQSRSTNIHEATADEILKMTETMNDADRFLVTFAAFTGLRAGECGGLRVGDIDFLGRTINVRRSVSEAHGKVQFGTPKNGKSRSVPIPPFLLGQLRVHLTGRGVDDDLTAQVFTSRNGGTYCHSNFSKRVFQPAMTASGQKGFRSHDQRP